MEDTVQRSCWGITIRAVVGIGAILGLVYLFVAV